MTNINLKDLNPLVNNIEEAKKIYLKPEGFYSLEKIEKYGTLALYLEKIF